MRECRRRLRAICSLRSSPHGSTGEDLQALGRRVATDGEKRSRNEFTLATGEKDGKRSRSAGVSWGLNIRPVWLPNRGKLDVDIFPQIIDDKPLFIVSQYGAHHVFIAVIFLSE